MDGLVNQVSEELDDLFKPFMMDDDDFEWNRLMSWGSSQVRSGPIHPRSGQVRPVVTVHFSGGLVFHSPSQLAAIIPSGRRALFDHSSSLKSIGLFCLKLLLLLLVSLHNLD